MLKRVANQWSVGDSRTVENTHIHTLAIGTLILPPFSSFIFFLLFSIYLIEIPE